MFVKKNSSKLHASSKYILASRNFVLFEVFLVFKRKFACAPNPEYDVINFVTRELDSKVIVDVTPVSYFTVVLQERKDSGASLK